MLKWYLRRLIHKERLRQISLGYTHQHDKKALERNPRHLLDEAYVHYNWGRYIQALALLQAEQDFYKLENNGKRTYSV